MLLNSARILGPFQAQDTTIAEQSATIVAQGETIDALARRQETTEEMLNRFIAAQIQAQAYALARARARAGACMRLGPDLGPGPRPAGPYGKTCKASFVVSLAHHKLIVRK